MVGAVESAAPKFLIEAFIDRRNWRHDRGAGGNRGATTGYCTGLQRIVAYAFSFPGLAGGEFAGKPILVVNTASQCGYTPQYAGLQELWTRFHDRGLMIVGVPSNDFGGQEPGGASRDRADRAPQYGVTFPLAAKAEVRGASAHPFYKWAAAERPTRCHAGTSTNT